MKILSLVGARPQFIKEALLNSTVHHKKAWKHVLVHSGQHYDINMSDVFFQELGIPKPAHYLDIGSCSHAVMTASVLVAVEKILIEEKPDALLVYGDTNTTLAGALAAVKIHVPIIHIEAGIRMLPKTMPEEINRVLTDHVSSLLCCCSELGRQNLEKEDIRHGVEVTGDIMYDLFLRMQPRFTVEKTCTKYGLVPEKFVLATLHRDYNVDSPVILRKLLEGLNSIQKEQGFTLFFPLHPRTRRRIAEFGLEHLLQNLLIAPPLGYLELMSLMCASAFAVTDSGGLQKEAFYANKRCIVMMPDTGWRELIDCGWNILCDPTQDSIAEAVESILTSAEHPGAIYGDGQAVGRTIQKIITAFSP